MGAYQPATGATAQRHRRKRTSLLTVGAVVGALLLASCGSGDTGSSPAATGGAVSPGSDATGSAPAEDLGTIRLMLAASNSIAYMAGQEGEDLGSWEDKPIEVEVSLGDATSGVQALAAGDIDVLIHTGPAAAIAISKGLEAKVVGAVMLPTSHFLLMGNHVEAASFDDLRGSTFGISGFGSAGHYATLRMAEDRGWAEGEDFEIAALGGREELAAALQRGDIDAFSWGVPIPQELEAQGNGIVLGPMADYVPPDVNGAIIASDNIIENNPAGLRAFMEGYYEGVEKLQSDPELAYQFTEEYGMDPDAGRAGADYLLPQLSTDGEIPPETLDAMIQAAQFIDEEVGELSHDEVYLHWEDLPTN